LAKKPLCLGKSCLEIKPWISHSENHVTKVYMRPKSGDKLDQLEADGSMMLFENLGFEKESMVDGKPDQIKEYMSLLIDFPSEIVYQKK